MTQEVEVGPLVQSVEHGETLYMGRKQTLSLSTLSLSINHFL